MAIRVTTKRPLLRRPITPRLPRTRPPLPLLTTTRLLSTQQQLRRATTPTPSNIPYLLSLFFFLLAEWTLDFLCRYNSAVPSYYTTTTYAPAPVYYSPPVYTVQAPSYSYQTEATASVYYKEAAELSSVHQYGPKYAEPSYYASAPSYYTTTSPSK